MPGLDSIVEVARKVSERGVALDAELCVKARNRNSSCDRCARSCMAGAVSIEECEVSVDPEACTGCGACVVACPTGALALVGETQSDLLDRALSAADAAGGEMVLACSELLEKASDAVDFTKVASVACLKSVSPEVLVEAVAFAGVGQIRLSHASCETCAYGGGTAAACANAERAREILEAWGSSAAVKVSGKLPRAVRSADERGYDPNRRLFFSEMRDSAKSVAQASIDTALEGVFDEDTDEERSIVRVNRFGVLPPGDSRRREALLDALDALEERRFAESDESAGDYSGERVVGKDAWARVSIDMARCRGCRMCAVFCPTGALFKFHTKKGLIGVKQRVRECVACGCCADVCPESALSLEPGVEMRQIVEDEVLRFVLPKPRPRREFPIEGVHVV